MFHNNLSVHFDDDASAPFVHSVESVIPQPSIERLEIHMKAFVKESRGQIFKTLVKLQCSAPCISSYNIKATMCQQCCKSGSSKIYKFIVGRLSVSLRKAHCSQHMATYNMQQPIRKRVTNYLNQSKQVVSYS